jgi:voltage-gated potassium channel
MALFSYSDDPLINRLMQSVLLILGSITLGATGFIVIEGFSLLEAFYMSIITLSTVGFTEVHPLSGEGRFFTSILILTNILIFAYAYANISSFFFEGGIINVFNKRKMTKEINALSDHVIVCGLGRIGFQVCQELLLENVPFLVIERDEAHIQKRTHQLKDLLYIIGEATDDQVLIKAGITRAKALITTLPNDSDNVYVTLSARDIASPDLRIISRVNQPSAEKKLYKAGCTNVVMPESIGGTHMATLVMKPDVLDFIRYITSPGQTDLFFVELTCSLSMDGKTIRELDIRNQTGANIIGFRLIDGQYVVNPASETKLISNSKLIALGNQNQIAKLKELFG